MTSRPRCGAWLAAAAAVFSIAAILPMGSAQDASGPGSDEHRRRTIERLFADIDRLVKTGEPEEVPDVAERIFKLERIDDPGRTRTSHVERRVRRELEAVLPLLEQVGDDEVTQVRRLAWTVEEIADRAAPVRRAAVAAEGSMKTLRPTGDICRGEGSSRAFLLRPAERFGDVLRDNRISRHMGPAATQALEHAIEQVRQRVRGACAATDPEAAAAQLREAERAFRAIDECAGDVLAWRVYLVRSSGDPEIPGGSLSGFVGILTEIEKRLDRLDGALAEVPAGLPAQLIGEAGRALEEMGPHLQRFMALSNALGQALRMLGRGDEPLPAWAHAVTEPRTSAQKALTELQWARDTLDEGRALAPEIRTCIERMRGAEGLAPVEGFFREADEIGRRCDAWSEEARRELERGRQCIAALARGAGAPPLSWTDATPGPGILTASPTPVPTALGLRPTPIPTPQAPPAAAPPMVDTPDVDPDVAGGLMITGPARIGVGWRVDYRATDHGGRPAADVSWYALSENVRVSGDGTVEGLAPGSATVMATAGGMRAFFDLVVIAADGAPAAPGGPSPVAAPGADVVVAPTDLTSGHAGTGSNPQQEGQDDRSEGGETAAATGTAAEGGFEDLGTEVGGETRPPDRTDDSAPSLMGATAAGGTAAAGGLPQIPNVPGSGDTFEDLGIEVGRPGDEPDPAETDDAGGGIGLLGVDVTDSQPGRSSRPTAPAESDTEPTSNGGAHKSVTPPADPLGSGDSSTPAGITFMGVEAGSAPSTTAPVPGGAAAPAPPSGGGGSPAPAASSRRPSPGLPPFVPQRVSVSGAGQPAAYHIFATCSRLGWAGALATYSVGPADAAIADHLLNAGEHAMWANRTSYPPTPAWPDWQARRALWGSWAARLAQTRDPVLRNQMAHALATADEPLAQSLAVQTVGETVHTASCDAEYCRLGFLMAWGQQSLAIAEEAMRTGNPQVGGAAVADGLQRLGLARRQLSGYQRIIPASGRCADLTAVGGQLDQAVGGGGSAAVRAAWETALRAIMALGTGQPPSDGSLLGAWVLADGRIVTVGERGGSLVGTSDGQELFRVRAQGRGSFAGSGLIVTRSGASTTSRWYDGMTIEVDGDTALGALGQFGFTMTRAGESTPRVAAGVQPPVRSRQPSEIEGYWQCVDPRGWPAPPPEDLWEVMEVRREGDAFVSRHCLPLPQGGSAGMRFVRTAPGSYGAQIEFEDSLYGYKVVREYRVTVSGDTWHEKSREYRAERPDAKPDWETLREIVYRRVALQGQCSGSDRGDCLYGLCSMCPPPDDLRWLMGVGRACRGCLDEIWSGNPPPIYRCMRADLRGRAVPVGTPGSQSIPSGPVPSRAPRLRPARPAPPSGEVEDMQMMGTGPPH